jgi:hypothetical protein
MIGDLPDDVAWLIADRLGPRALLCWGVATKTRRPDVWRLLTRRARAALLDGGRVTGLSVRALVHQLAPTAPKSLCATGPSVRMERVLRSWPRSDVPVLPLLVLQVHRTPRGSRAHVDPRCRALRGKKLAAPEFLSSEMLADAGNFCRWCRPARGSWSRELTVHVLSSAVGIYNNPAAFARARQWLADVLRSVGRRGGSLEDVALAVEAVGDAIYSYADATWSS